MERELNREDPQKTKMDGHEGDTKDNNRPAKGKKVAHDPDGGEILPETVKPEQTKMGGVREDQPGRDPLGDRNAI